MYVCVIVCSRCALHLDVYLCVCYVVFAVLLSVSTALDMASAIYDMLTMCVLSGDGVQLFRMRIHKTYTFVSLLS